VDLAEEVRSLVQARADEHGIKLISESTELAGDIEADPRATRALLVNLVENSLDACRLDGAGTNHEVTLRVTGFSDHVQYEVLDNGIGMDQETRDKAFSLFFSSKGSAGTGLGLFIANRIARAHGGTITLESELGVGTRFIVKLPRKRPPQESENALDCEKETFDG
jgi:signal transduction histidine kinase